jgi:hypothetical protein
VLQPVAEVAPVAAVVAVAVPEALLVAPVEMVGLDKQDQPVF